MNPIPLSRPAKIVAALILLALAIAGRLLPHPGNFTPLAATALFASATFGLGYSLGITALTMIVTDPLLGLYEPPVMASVYASLILVSVLGRLIRGRRFAPVLGASVLGSVLFFLFTNAAVWAFTPHYAPTWSGLLTSYAMGLPFFRNTLLGDVVYTGALFGAWALVGAAYRVRRRRFAVLV